MTDFNNKYEGKDLAFMASNLKKLREKHGDLKSKAAVVWQEVDYLRLYAIPAKLDELGIDSVKLKGIGRVHTQVQASCSTKDKEALYEWLRANDAGDMISSTVNSSTLKSFLSNRIKEGEQLPPDEVVEFKPFVIATITQA